MYQMPEYDDPRTEGMCALYPMRDCIGEADGLVCGNVCQRVDREIKVNGS